MDQGEKVDVFISGAGPVGLFFALRVNNDDKSNNNIHM